MFRRDRPAMLAVMAAVAVAMLAPMLVQGQTPEWFDMGPTWTCSEAEEAEMLAACPGVFNTVLLADIKSTGSDPMELFKETPEVAAGICSNDGCLTHITGMSCLPPDAAAIAAICACGAAIPDNCATAMYAAISSGSLLEDSMTSGDVNDADIDAYKGLTAPFCAAGQTCMSSMDSAGSACELPKSMLAGNCCMYDLVEGDDNCLAALSDLTSGGDQYAAIEAANTTEELQALGINTVADLMLNPLTAVCENAECFPKLACMQPPSEGTSSMDEANDVEEVTKMCAAINEVCVRNTIGICFDMELEAFMQMSGGEGLFGARRRRLLQDPEMDLEQLFSEGGANQDDPMMQMMMQMMMSMLGPIMEPLCNPCCVEAVNSCDVSAIPSMSELTELSDSGMCAMMNFTYPVDVPCPEPGSIGVGAFEAGGDSHATAMAPFASVLFGLITLFALAMHRN